MRELPFPLSDERARIYEFARQGLWHGLQTLDLQSGAEILVPAYNHGSELEVMEKAGFRLRFYGRGDDLEPDHDELAALVGPETRALYLIHYLGRAQDSARWRKWCDDRGLLLLEDVAMAWLAGRDGVPAGKHADLAIYSPWKTVGLYDVGAMICARPPAPVEPTRRPLAGFIARSHLRWIAGRSPLVGDLIRRRRTTNAAQLRLPDDEWGLLDPDAGPAAVSLFLLKRLATSTVAPARRRNYARLHAKLAAWVAPGFEELDDESCPFAFPIATEDKHGLVAALAAQGIEVLDLWSLPHPSAPSADDFPAAARRRATTVGLPVHQELRSEDVDRIADAVVAYLRDGRRPAAATPIPGPGDTAPAFELSDQDGARVTLDDHAGKNVVLYFYPEADTPGCTAQACALRDARTGFRDENAVVLGVSPDSQAKLHAFADEYGLPFTLLADEGHRIADRYGVWRAGSRLRRTEGENERTTFLIGPDGTVRRVFRNVDPDHHDALVLAELRTTRGLAVEA